MKQLPRTIVGLLVVGLFALDASGQDGARSRGDGQRILPYRNLEPIPLSEGERLRVGRDFDTRAADANFVYSNIEPGGFFFPNGHVEQSLQGLADDMILAPGDARELFSYAAVAHQRSAEGPLGFTVHLSLQEDDGTGVGSLPLSGLSFIEGTQCSVPDIHGLGRPDEGFAQCVPNEAGKSGIIIGDKVWLKVVIEGGCVGTNQELPGCTEPGPGFFGPGIILTEDGNSATVGSTEETLVQSIGDLQGLISFGGPAMAAECAAGVPAPIPTVSEWGMVVIAMLVLTGGTIILRRSRRAIVTR